MYDGSALRRRRGKTVKASSHDPARQFANNSEQQRYVDDWADKYCKTKSVSPPDNQKGSATSGYWFAHNRAAAQQRMLLNDFHKLHRKLATPVLGIFGVILMTWYLTPASDMLADLWLTRIPISEDIKLGKKQFIDNKMVKVEDPIWSPIVRSIGKGLVQSNPNLAELGFKWEFGIVKSDLATGYALPGGSVFITDTLITSLHNRPSKSFLAGVLAHEMGHVNHRHGQRNAQKAKVASVFASFLAYVLESPFSSQRILLSKEKNGSIDPSFRKMAAGLLRFGERGFSRRDEFQADATACEILTNASKTISEYTPFSLYMVLYLFDKAEGMTTGTSNAGGWTSTHPATSERLKFLEKKWNPDGTWRQYLDKGLGFSATEY